MNRLKKIFISAVAVLMTLVCAFSFAGCSNSVVDVELKLSIYNFSENEMGDYSLDIDIYQNLAPKTAQAIKKYLDEGYYDNAVFYKMTEYENQFMIGDLKYDATLEENEGFYLNDQKPALEGEFKQGGTIGSNLKNKRGSIGLWRTWTAQDIGYNMGSTGTETGRATWFMPTSTINSYDDYFCVFAQYDINDSNIQKTITALSSTFSNADRYQEFVIYYTGEYDNLKFNCVKKEAFKESEIADLFKAEENSTQLVCYNHYTIQVPMTESGDIAARIVDAKVGK